MKTIKFLHPVSGYSAGEIAGFEDAIAERMVTECLAELYSPPTGPGDFTLASPRQPAAEDPAREKAQDGPPAHTMVTGHQTVRKEASQDRTTEAGNGRPKAPGKRIASLLTKGET
jgi:hypothetical protein